MFLKTVKTYKLNEHHLLLAVKKLNFKSVSQIIPKDIYISFNLDVYFIKKTKKIKKLQILLLVFINAIVWLLKD